MSTRKRVGGGFKIIPQKPKEVIPETIQEKAKPKTEIQMDSGHTESDGTEKQDLPEKLESEVEKLQLTDDLVNYDDHPLFRYIQDNVIGHDAAIECPFGPRKIVYCDYTASGRSLSFIEDYIRTYVNPFYANTHSTTGFNARQTSKYREEARTIIKKCVNASKDDVVIFTGSGTTAGIHKVAWALKINHPRVAEETVVFVGPYEHHSNILPWKEYGTKVVRIRDIRCGYVDLDHLESELKFWKERKTHLLVAMSAASNVTGILTDTEEVATIAHKYGALVIFDYAAGAPYIHIDMNPCKQSYKDAVILSPHKFVGGPGTPGLVIAKKWLFKNSVPDRVGGGTVRYVTRTTHMYLGNIEEREEGGTPAIIESIRAGLTFQLKEAVGADIIEAREEDLCRRAFAVWQENPNIIILGSHTTRRIPIFSFLVRNRETGRYVHHNFISTLLSDLYGIQARGGCACAGPYAADLLGMSESKIKNFTWFLNERPGKDATAPAAPVEVMKPGFTRVNIPYFYDDDTVDFIINAIDEVCKYGWRLLPQYTFDTFSGTWIHKDFSNKENSALFSLTDVTYDTHGMANTSPRMPRRTTNLSYEEVLRKAEKLYEEAPTDVKGQTRSSIAMETLKTVLPKERKRYRWFMTPEDAMSIMADTNQTYLQRKPYRSPFKMRPQTPRDTSLSSLHSHSLTDRSEQAQKQRNHSPTRRDKFEGIRQHKHQISTTTEEHSDNSKRQYRHEALTKSDANEPHTHLFTVKGDNTRHILEQLMHKSTDKRDNNGHIPKHLTHRPNGTGDKGRHILEYLTHKSTDMGHSNKHGLLVHGEVPFPSRSPIDTAVPLGMF